ncbi:NAD-dependent protein deacetylase sirtuin-2 isoform X1 [Varanus komodoensis]|uniref:NAD-dependent protein deacetylase sirtuin-2 isoform X1 n=2 Tax=Varanus komodoensis TaxID=61221 RepID=UPI001CF7D358|nr:NAD-dependent protein deacetylase sirtuin-2 isoform X1 [Varanus komodoensis]
MLPGGCSIPVRVTAAAVQFALLRGSPQSRSLRRGDASWKAGKDSDSDDEAGASGQTEMEFLRNCLSRTLGLGSEKPEKVLDELTLEGVSKFMLSDKCKKVICMVGAGISTAAGIPDLRSPGTGIYANLQQYNLPYPEAIFDISYFRQHPEPFFALARELYPGFFKPTICHYFIRLLKEKGLLLRCYTQNIDTLERVAGLDEEDLVEAHGTFFTSHCIRSTCRKTYSLDWMKEKFFSGLVPKCEKCQGVVKPDIVFFGESLPSRFFSLMQSDFRETDLLIIMGTSLQVQPFASLVSRVSQNTPRLLINKEKTGESDPVLSLMGFGCGMNFDSEKAYRDVAWLGDCEEGCLALAELLGWKKELEELVKKEHAAIDAESGQAVADAANASCSLVREKKQNSSPEKETPPGKKEE